MREIKELQEQLHQQKQDNKDLERELYWAQQVLGAIVAADRVDVIVAKLQKGHTPESIARELGLTSEEALGMPRRRGSVRGSSVIEESGLDERSNDFSSERRTSWTRVSLDPYLLNQLMQLYFQWIHPVYMLFSKTLFLEGFNTRKGPHCSSALVNAIYAVAADLLDPSTLKALDTRRLIDGIREDFANEARSHLVSEKKTTATTVQTLAVLFLVDSGAGETSQASAYLETALVGQLNLQSRSQVGRRSLRITSNGLYILAVYISLETRLDDFRRILIVIVPGPRPSTMFRMLVDSPPSTRIPRRSRRTMTITIPGHPNTVKEMLSTPSDYIALQLQLGLSSPRWSTRPTSSTTAGRTKKQQAKKSCSTIGDT